MPVSTVHMLSAPERGHAPGLRLNAHLYVPEAPTLRYTPPSTPARKDGLPRGPGLIVGHGAGSRAARHSEFCQAACDQGFVVLAPDFRGHGDSQGYGDGPLEEDVLAAARYLRGHPAVDPRAVCYRGSSMGGFYGLKAASEAGFAAMVLICPATEDGMLAALAEDDASSRHDTESQEDQDAASSGDAPRWDRPRMRAYFAKQDSRALASLVRCPVLLVHARPDAQVPIEHSVMLARSLSGPACLLALEAGTHSSAQHDPVVHATTLAWLKAQAAAVRSA